MQLDYFFSESYKIEIVVLGNNCQRVCPPPVDGLVVDDFARRRFCVYEVTRYPSEFRPVGVGIAIFIVISPTKGHI